jgi:hypothetical protein
LSALREPRVSILFALSLILALTLALPSASDAKPDKKHKLAAKIKPVPVVGVADNNAPMFHDKNYAAVGTQISRRIVPYDFYQDPVQLQRMDAWMHGAADAGIDPLISFEHSYTYPTKLPSVSEYGRALKFALKRYPNLKTISPWNEANHKSQPTVHHPKRAAQYYNKTRIICRYCRIVAADVLDQKNLMPWLKIFTRYAKKPTIWGLHSYTDSNRKKSWKKSTTKAFLSKVKGEVWLTEVGGIVAFNYSYNFDENRAARATRGALNLGLKSPRIKRIYLYCWFGSQLAGQGSFPFTWDSGIVGPDGQPRPAYFSVKKWLEKNPQP